MSNTATLKVREIARGLSLSPGTVSRALRARNGEVSIATTEKVLQYCVRHGYMSKMEAERLTYKIKVQVTNKRIAIVTTKTGMVFYSKVLSGICEQIQDYDFHSTSLVISESIGRNLDFKELGAVIAVGRTDPRYINECLKSNIPIVLVDDYSEEFSVASVNSNNLESIIKSVKRLADLGHQRIAFLCRHEDMPYCTNTFHLRETGYLSGLTSAGLPFKEEYLITFRAPAYNETDIARDLPGDDVRALAERVVSLNPRPTAVITANDGMAKLLIDVLSRHNLRVPDDISVIGYDGLHYLLPEHVSSTYTRLATNVVRWDEMGREAAELAMEGLIEGQLLPKRLEVPTIYENRETVSKPDIDPKNQAVAQCDSAL